MQIVTNFMEGLQKRFVVEINMWTSPAQMHRLLFGDHSDLRMRFRRLSGTFFRLLLPRRGGNTIV